MNEIIKQMNKAVASATSLGTEDNGANGAGNSTAGDARPPTVAAQAARLRGTLRGVDGATGKTASIRPSLALQHTPTDLSEVRTVSGVIYAVPHCVAVEKGWKMLGFRPKGRNGMSVKIRCEHKGRHEFVSIPELGPMFYQSSLATAPSDPDPVESSSPLRPGTQNKTLIFPDLDRILAKTLLQPIEFVRQLARTGWLTHTEALGDVASALEKHFDACKEAGKWSDLNTDQIAVHQLDALLTLAQFSSGRGGDTLWLGCPATPQQLLHLVQLRLQIEYGDQWICPSRDDVVDLIGRIDQTAVTARSMTEMLRTNNDVDWTSLRSVIGEHRHLRAEAQLLGGMSWNELCKAADRPELESLISLLQEQLTEQSILRARQPFDTTGMKSDGQRPTFLLRPEPKEGSSKLTAEETERLNEYLKRDATREIDISQARLFTEAAGTEICSLQAGGSDLAPVALSEVLKDYVLAVRQELCPETSLRMIPTVALAKVLTLRVMPSDNFILEHFGFVTWKDPTIGPRKMAKVKGLYRDMYAMQAKKDIWAPIESIDDLANVMEGLQIAVRRMLHPSILSADDIAALWRQVKDIFIEHGGRARVVTLTEAIKARLEEHVQLVRRKVGGSSDVVPTLTAWGQRSQTLIDWATKKAETACIASISGENGDTGETAVGEARPTTKGIDPDGKQYSYKRKVPDDRQPAAGPLHPAGAPRRGSNSSLLVDATDGDQQAKRRRIEKREPQPCLKCNGSGHKMAECKSQKWCAIMKSWPKALQQIAKMARLHNGATPIWQEVPPDVKPGDQRA